jgi:hypothetical protein
MPGFATGRGGQCIGWKSMYREFKREGNGAGPKLNWKIPGNLARPEAWRSLISSSPYSGLPPLAAQRLELRLLVDKAEMFQPDPTFEGKHAGLVG